jgi:hypothetical protein
MIEGWTQEQLKCFIHSTTLLARHTYWSQILQKALDNLDLRSVIYQLQLITTWGDPYYVGLNGLQFYDAQHNRIELTESSKLYVCLFMMILMEVYI